MQKEKSWMEQQEQKAIEQLSGLGDIIFSIPALSAYDCEKLDQSIDDEPKQYISEKTMDQQIDELEALLLKEGNLVDCPLKHVFTPGLYTRTILMQEGALVTSMVHRERHQYVVSKGSALVKIGNGEWIRIDAPYVGITEAGTRRVLFILEECVWTTAHKTEVLPLDESKEALDVAVESVEDQIFIKRENAMVGGFVKNNCILKTIEQ